MNKIELIKKAVINFDIASEVEYQVILELNKKKDTQDLPQGVWEERNISHSEIESKIFNLITKSGYDFKILFLWFKYYIYCNNISAFLEVLQYLLNEHDNIEKIKNNTEMYLILDFLDLCLSKAVNNIKLENLEFKISDFTKERETYVDNIKKLTDQEIYKIYNTYLTCSKNLTFFSSTYKYDLKKTKYIIDFIEVIVNLYKDYLNSQGFVNESIEEPSAIIQYKKEAIDHIEKSLEILYKIDKQNIAIPVLEKIIRWKDYTISDILSELEDDASMIAFLKFIKH